MKRGEERAMRRTVLLGLVLVVSVLVAAACRGADSVGLPPEAKEATPTSPPAPTPSPVSGAPAATPAPPPGPGVSLPQDVGEVDQFFRPLLEEAIGRPFVPQEYFLGKQEGVTVIQITYRIVGDVPDLREASGRLAGALTARGAMGVSVDAEATDLEVLFNNLPYGGRQVFFGVIVVQSTGEAQVHVQIEPG